MRKCDGYCNTKRGIFLFTAVLFVSTHIRSSVKSPKHSVQLSSVFPCLSGPYIHQEDWTDDGSPPCQERVMLTYCSKVLIYLTKSCNTVMNFWYDSDWIIIFCVAWCLLCSSLYVLSPCTSFEHLYMSLLPVADEDGVEFMQSLSLKHGLTHTIQRSDIFNGAISLYKNHHETILQEHPF